MSMMQDTTLRSVVQLMFFLDGVRGQRARLDAHLMLLMDVLGYCDADIDPYWAEAADTMADMFAAHQAAVASKLTAAGRGSLEECLHAVWLDIGSNTHCNAIYDILRSQADGDTAKVQRFVEESFWRINASR